MVVGRRLVLKAKTYTLSSSVRLYLELLMIAQAQWPEPATPRKKNKQSSKINSRIYVCMFKQDNVAKAPLFKLFMYISEVSPQPLHESDELICVSVSSFIHYGLISSKNRLWRGWIANVSKRTKPLSYQGSSPWQSHLKKWATANNKSPWIPWENQAWRKRSSISHFSAYVVQALKIFSTLNVVWSIVHTQYIWIDLTQTKIPRSSNR